MNRVARTALVATLALLGSEMSCAESVFEVEAGCSWAETGVGVLRGREYDIEVIEPMAVRDAHIVVTDLNGWPSCWQTALAPFFFLKRRPFDPWFALIVTVDRRAPIRLRKGVPYVAPATGKLVCYFNDAPWLYSNNSGRARIRIRPLRHPINPADKTTR